MRRCLRLYVNTPTREVELDLLGSNKLGQSVCSVLLGLLLVSFASLEVLIDEEVSKQHQERDHVADDELGKPCGVF